MAKRESYGYGDLDCLECDYVVGLRISAARVTLDRIGNSSHRERRSFEIVSKSELFALKF